MRMLAERIGRCSRTGRDIHLFRTSGYNLCLWGICRVNPDGTVQEFRLSMIGIPEWDAPDPLWKDKKEGADLGNMTFSREGTLRYFHSAFSDRVDWLQEGF